MTYTLGELVENNTGPMIVQSIQTYPSGGGSVTTLRPAPGPRTAAQQAQASRYAELRDADSEDLRAFEAMSELERSVYNAIIVSSFIENGAMLGEIRKVAREIVQLCQSEK